ncbi:cytochrome P450 [Streptomyces purpureus]|uniref:Cytochrome P450 n=1 Tax=Streptomyces purpureus TaxID=1951 RepID=A0A918GZ34_9ACTN|nr:cytochrome P450 [Streptomyces purpureus]GGT18313.1 hypothetical protein GCM10014713_08970 [Streptomyces purpureus]
MGDDPPVGIRRVGLRGAGTWPARPPTPARTKTPSPAKTPPAPHRPGSRTVAPSPLGHGVAKDPYPLYRILREEFPLTYDPDLRAWLLSRYADVAAALTDPRFTRGHRPGDPPCAPAHQGDAAAGLRHVAERVAHVLARRLAGRHQVDLVEDFCRWLPAGTAAAAVGVPYRDMMRLVRGRAAGSAAGRCTSLITLRQKALASFLANILDDPDQLAAVRTGPPELLRRAWTESLRRDPPVQIAVRRTTHEVEVSGGTIPAGASVALLIGAAGRDPERFTAPDRFDLLRDDPGQLTFGTGFCPAVVLAALEADFGLRALLEAMPRLRWADGFRPDHTGVITRAPRALLVRPAG